MEDNTRFRHLGLHLSAIKAHFANTAHFLASLKTAALAHPAIEFLRGLSLSGRSLSRKNPIIRYLHNLISTIIEAGLLVAAVGGLCFILYYVMDLMWYLYVSTPMGEKFITLHPQRTATLYELSNLDLIYFCTELTLSAFALCFLIAAICQFTHISHYFYLSRGFFGKLICWGAPLTGAVAFYIQKTYGFSDWHVVAGIVMIPTLLMFMNCFKYSQKLIPEAGELINVTRPWVKKCCHISYNRISTFIRTCINP